MAQIVRGCNWGGTGLSCPGIPAGNHSLRMTPDAMAFVDVLLQRRNETAGALAIDVNAGVLDIVQTSVTKGKRDTVGIPRGSLFPFHSHPGKCPPRGADCALDVPSDADIALVMEDCMQGSHAHFVFAQTGTFVVSLDPGLRRYLGGLAGGQRRAAEKRIERVFAEVHKKFERRLQQGNTDLEVFRPEWTALARQQGFDVRFFPKGQVPSVTLTVV